MPDPPAASSFSAPGGELHLSNQGQLELLRGMRERGASLRTPVHGWSMTPFIRDGDVVTIAPIGPVAPRLGDVLAVELAHGSLLVIHRVVRRVDRGWLLRGDNATAPDGVVPRGARARTRRARAAPGARGATWPGPGAGRDRRAQPRRRAHAARGAGAPAAPRRRRAPPKLAPVFFHLFDAQDPVRQQRTRDVLRGPATRRLNVHRGGPPLAPASPQARSTSTGREPLPDHRPGQYAPMAQISPREVRFAL